MTKPTGEKPLFTPDFIGLCLFIFLAYCNITVFYSLEVHLTRLAVDTGWRGFLIGSSSLATIAAYLFLSPYMTKSNAPRNACAGALLLMACGVAYLHAGDPWNILAVRLLNGLGVYLLLASSMTLLVERIPPGRSGQAFGMYSVAILLPYSVVPAVFDSFIGRMDSLAQGYMIMSLVLAPSLVLIPVIGRRARASRAPGAPDKPLGMKAMVRNARRKPVAMLLLLSACYVSVFSMVYFLSKVYFQTLGVTSVGPFFSLQTACIIVVRLTASHLFDRLRKMRLIAFCFALSGISCALAATATGLPQLLAAAVVMGVGMGAGAPALNSLMFSISEPELRGVNSNLVTMAMQLGSFLGPLLGASTSHAFGPSGFLWLGMGVCVGGLGLCALAVSTDLDRGDPARG